MMVNDPSKLTQLMLYLEGYFSDGKPTLLSMLMDDVQIENEKLREYMFEQIGIKHVPKEFGGELE